MKIISVILVLTNIAIGQNPRDFWPFHEGDIWQYQTNDGEYYNKTILKDSCDIAGNHYLEYKYDYLNVPGFWIEYWMIDTLNKVWLFDHSFEDSLILVFDLNKDIYEWFYMGYGIDHQFKHVVDTGSTLIFGLDSKYKTYEAYLCGWEDCPPDSMGLQLGLSTLAEGFGEVYSTADGYVEYLYGAIIDSQKYGTIIGIEHENEERISSTFYLHPAYPNPFNSQVNMKLTLSSSSNISLAIYDMLGRKIMNVFSGSLRAGNHHYYWKGVDQFGNQVASGIYILNLISGDFSATQKFIYLK